jgi:tetratricopeptide (TPR) repeat protein
MIPRAWATLLAIGLSCQPLSAETTIPPMPNPLPGTWEDRSELREILPLFYDSIWYDAETASLLHFRSGEQEPIDREIIDALLHHMRQSTSFWGEPSHPNAAQFFANTIYLQPQRYDQVLHPIVERALTTGKLVETPGIWALEGMAGNPHIFYHAQLTPRIDLAIVDGQLQIGESYVPLDVTRTDFATMGDADVMVLEVQTQKDAIDEAVDALEMPAWLKTSRFRYCAVQLAPEGFAAPPRTLVSLASPLASGIDCNDVVAALGFDPVQSFPRAHIEDLLADGRIDEAVQVATRAATASADDLSLRGEVVYPLLWRARALYGTRDYEASAVLLRSALDVALVEAATAAEDPNHCLLLGLLHYNHGRSLRRLSRYDEALTALDEALALTAALLEQHEGQDVLISLMGNIHHYRGRSLEALDRDREAIDAYGEAVTFDPDDDIAHKRRGVLAFNLGDYAQAIGSLETAIALDPDYGTALNWLAWTYATAGLPEYRNPERAVELAEAALAIEENHDRYDTLGAARLGTGDAEAALEAYRKARTLDADYAERLVGDLRSLGCLAETPADPGPDDVDAALALCLARGLPPFVLAEGIDLIDRIKSSDPELARRHLAVLSDRHPQHPEVLRLQSEARDWSNP